MCLESCTESLAIDDETLTAALALSCMSRRAPAAPVPKVAEDFLYARACARIVTTVPLEASGETGTTPRTPEALDSLGMAVQNAGGGDDEDQETAQCEKPACG